MTHWICTRDRHRLSRQGDALHCRHCGRQYPCAGELPVFVRHAEAAPASPLLQQIWQLLQQRGVEEAAAEFCRIHACAREGRSAGWQGFVPVPEGGRVLEIGAGFGDDTLELARQAAEIVSLVPSANNGQIVRRHLEQERATNVRLAVVDDLRRLPLEDRSIDTIAMEQVATAGFGVSRASLDEVLAEWQRVLSPGGRVVLGLANRFSQALRLARLAPGMAGDGSLEPINRVIRRAAAGGTSRQLGLGHVVRSLRRQGFGAPSIYAPLPDLHGVKIVVPLEDPGVVRYCFGQLLRQNSWTLRSMVHAVHLALRLGLLRRVVPYYFLMLGPER